MYISVMEQLDPSHSGELSLPAIQRMLATAGLPASTVEKVRPHHSARLPSWALTA